jgi:hypothetical protein
VPLLDVMQPAVESSVGRAHGVAMVSELLSQGRRSS